ncbi:MAG: hypothetical protein HY291_09070 [Planctomycetes bacterium]|nr:hypothetical protein [Planctomycetota bacterium]
MKRYLAVLTACLLGCGLAGAEEKTEAKTEGKTPAETPKKEPAAAEGATPEAEVAVRSLLLAMVDQDAAKIKAVIVDNPDSKLLADTMRVTPAQATELKKGFAGMKFTYLKKGDKIDAPEGGQATVGDIPADHLLLLGKVGEETMPLPFYVVKTKDKWLVDAGALIAMRKAAGGGEPPPPPPPPKGEEKK